MTFHWLKRLTPRDLYGRAALILIVPIVAIQLIVSTAFIQRYFADVTRQMTGNLAIDLAQVLAPWEAEADRDLAVADAMALADALRIGLSLPEGPVEVTPVRAFYDLSGLSVARVLRETFPQIGGIDLGARQKVVRFDVATRHGRAVVQFSRARVSASNPHQLLVIITLAAGLFTVIGYIFLRNQLRPIKRLATAADAFGKGRVVP